MAQKPVQNVVDVLTVEPVSANNNHGRGQESQQGRRDLSRV